MEHRFANALRNKDVDGIMANYERSQNLVFFDVVTRQEFRGWNEYKNDWQSDALR